MQPQKPESAQPSPLLSISSPYKYNYSWSVITPVCNRADLTVSTLSWHFAAYASKPDIPFEFILVDNGSNDRTPAILGMYKPMYQDRLKIIRNEENRGFGEANNQAVEIAEGEALLFLNNDIEFRGDYLQSLDAILARNPEALIGPQLINFDTGWNRFKGNIIIKYIGGWCLAMAAQVFRGLGQFDSRYAPADYEDVDLCYTAQEAGRELVQVNLPIFHIADQTAPVVLPNRRQITIRNRQRFADKWGLVVEGEKI